MASLTTNIIYTVKHAMQLISFLRIFNFKIIYFTFLSFYSGRDPRKEDNKKYLKALKISKNIFYLMFTFYIRTISYVQIIQTVSLKCILK